MAPAPKTRGDIGQLWAERRHGARQLVGLGAAGARPQQAGVVVVGGQSDGGTTELIGHGLHGRFRLLFEEIPGIGKESQSHISFP
jgi:hypothetical protein